jgi:ribosomal protein L9
MELITIFSPATIDFVRQPIEEENSPSGPRLGASETADILAAAEKAEKSAGKTGIYGSVTTADVAASIRESLADNEEAARVILSENDIRFVEGLVDGETSRVKHLGKFKVEIHVKGAEKALPRSVRVLPQK